MYLSALSEMDNLEENMSKLLEQTITFGVEVADHLERALMTVDKGKPSKEKDTSLLSLYDNLKKIDEQMGKVFSKNGLARIRPIGELFDPDYHEVYFEVEGDRPGTIATVVLSGYVLNGKPIRPAKVGVVKHKSK